MKEQQQLNSDLIKNTPKYTEETEEPGEMSRRQALATLGKFALVTAPIMTTLLTSAKATTWSVQPPNTPG